MSVNHSKYPLQLIRTRECGDSGGATNNIMKAGRRRRLLLARDASNLSNSSMEGGSGGGSGGEYHAQASVAVPFIWESSPGTPKRYVASTNKSSFREVDNNKLLPSLTPPPSYEYHRSRNYATPRIRFSKKNKQNNSNVNLIQTIFPRLSLKRDHPPSLSPSSSESRSPSYSSSSSSSPSSKSRSMISTPSPINRMHRLSFDLSAEIEVEEEEVVMGGGGSPISTLCFRRLSCCNGRLRGLYSNWF